MSSPTATGTRATVAVRSAAALEIDPPGQRIDFDMPRTRGNDDAVHCVAHEIEGNPGEIDIHINKEKKWTVVAGAR